MVFLLLCCFTGITMAMADMAQVRKVVVKREEKFIV